jgi:hypothetical protein
MSSEEDTPPTTTSLPEYSSLLAEGSDCDTMLRRVVMMARIETLNEILDMDLVLLQQLFSLLLLDVTS